MSTEQFSTANLVSALIPPRVPEPDLSAQMDTAPAPADIPSLLTEASRALLTGRGVDLACGGVGGQKWRVRWELLDVHGSRQEQVGVLDPAQRTFTATATAPESLAGFALAMHGLAFSLPHTQFDGEWSAVLAMESIEGEEALAARRLEGIQTSVIAALRTPTANACRPTEVQGDGDRPWTFILDADPALLPVIGHPPESLSQALRGAGASVTAAFGSLTSFAAVAASWDRTGRRFTGVANVKPQVRQAVMALAAHQHLVLVGPSGEGKSACAKAALSALQPDRPLLPAVSLEHYGTPEKLLRGEAPRMSGLEAGPLAPALHANEGAGYPARLTCRGDIPAALVPPLRALLSEQHVPRERAPQESAEEVGSDFRVILEVTTDDDGDGLPEHLLEVIAGRGNVSVLRFTPPTEREAELLLHAADVGLDVRGIYLAAYVVEEVRIAVHAGVLPRSLSSDEVLRWAALAAKLREFSVSGDAKAVLEDAALMTWVPVLEGAATWFESHAPIARAEAAYRAELRQGTVAASPIDWHRELPGTRAWYRYEAVRQAIDDITAVVAPEAYLTLLEQASSPTPEGLQVAGWWSQSRFCHVYLATNLPPEVAFAEAVHTAAHERAHARWTPASIAVCFPQGTVAAFETVEEGSEADRRRKTRIRHAYNVLEDHRIERLLDTIDDARLQTYRRRAANEYARWASPSSGAAFHQLLELLHYFVTRFAAVGDAAFEETLTRAEETTLERVLLLAALSSLRMVEADPADVSILPQATQVLTGIFGAVEQTPPG